MCLRSIGQEHVWDDLIFPGMSESIYAVLQATIENSFYRPKTFQLFGADFVITDNYIPYLIEINSIPGLNPSTSVIANLVPMLLADIIKGMQYALCLVRIINFERFIVVANELCNLFGLLYFAVYKCITCCYIFQVVVDTNDNSNANTGLFIKVVPEKFKPVKAVRGPTEGTPFSPPKVMSSNVGPIQAYDYNSHRQWVENVNNKLTAIQFRINTQDTPIDRYFGYNRDNLLMSTVAPATMTTVFPSTGMNIETIRNTPVTTTGVIRETMLKADILSPEEKIAKLKMKYAPRF